MFQQLLDKLYSSTSRARLVNITKKATIQNAVNTQQKTKLYVQ